MKVLCCCFVLFNDPTDKKSVIPMVVSMIQPWSRAVVQDKKVWSDRRKLWRAWKHGLLLGILMTNPDDFKCIPANTVIEYELWYHQTTSKYQQQLTKHVTHGFCIYIYIYIYPGCNLAAAIVDVVVSSPTLKNKNAKKKRTFSWTTTLHSGRWTAGTYSHHPPIFKGKMIWTKPPGNYVPC